MDCTVRRCRSPVPREVQGSAGAGSAGPVAAHPPRGAAGAGERGGL